MKTPLEKFATSNCRPAISFLIGKGCGSQTAYCQRPGLDNRKTAIGLKTEFVNSQTSNRIALVRRGKFCTFHAIISCPWPGTPTQLPDNAVNLGSLAAPDSDRSSPQGAGLGPLGENCHLPQII